MERAELEKRLAEARTAEARLVEYPSMDGLISYLTLIETATSKAKIMELTTEFDLLVKQGWSWGEKWKRTIGVEVAQPLVEAVYEIALVKRASVCPPYTELAYQVDLERLEWRRRGLAILGQEGATEEKIPDRKLPAPYNRVVWQLSQIARLLRQPHLVGLFEETEFPTLRKEIRCYVAFTKMVIRKELISTKRIDELQQKIKAGLDRRSAAYQIQSRKENH